MSESNICACGSPAVNTCCDCQGPLCEEHSCSACGRCEADCICHLRWWLPDFF